ncbi:MAG TPA: class I SAM-dependent methyltransferase, partial [Opitutaceae bacterium]
MSPRCPLCSSDRSRTFFELTEMPVSIGVQWPTAAEARRCARADLRLAFCEDCGFIWNDAFDPARMEYSQAYDNSLDFSPVFQTYARGLAQRLVNTYDVRKKDVVEIGCGKGQFLSLLCEEGGNRGIGFDPSYEGDRVQSPAMDRITYVRDFYGEAYATHAGDLVCCRHVFEHISDPVGFLTMVRRTLGDRHSAVVYFEVPNVRFILERLSVWDIIYEHCNYFGVESAAHVFRRCGFEIVRLAEAYDGQFLAIEARPATFTNGTVSPLHAG